MAGNLTVSGINSPGTLDLDDVKVNTKLDLTGAEVVGLPEVELSGTPLNSIMSIYVETSNDVADLEDQGWWLCDGNNGTPNLIGQFIRGGTPGLNVDGNQVPGSTSTDAHTLSAAEMPSHSHSYQQNLNWSGPNGSGSSQGDLQSSTSTGANGGSGSHSHTMSATPDHVYIGYFMYKGVA